VWAGDDLRCRGSIPRFPHGGQRVGLLDHVAERSLGAVADTAFLAGRTQGQPRRAAGTGLVVRLTALAGYFAMTLSPMEGVHFHLAELSGLVRSNAVNVVGGLVMGPLFGWLGYRWRTGRSWLAATLVVGALCMEPFAVTAVGRDSGQSQVVWMAEVFAGVATGAWCLAVLRGYRRAFA
jgi:hypothetical protein